MNKNKKGNFLSFILPYVLILGIIITVLFMFNGANTSKTKEFSEAEIVTIRKDETYTEDELNERLNKSVLWTYEITSLSIVYKEPSNIIS